MDHSWKEVIFRTDVEVNDVFHCERCGTKFPIIYDPRKSDFDWKFFSVSSDCDIQIAKGVLLT